MLPSIRITILLVAVCTAAPAAAQYTFAQPGQQSQPVQQLQVWNNVARLNLGVSFYNSGFYNCSYYYYPYTCNSGSYTSYIPFTFGPEVDLNLGGMNNIGLGLNISMGTITSTYYSSIGSAATSKSTSVTIWEPFIDYVATFGPPTQDTVGRFRVGGAMYFGPNSKIGGAFRIGGGA